MLCSMVLGVLMAGAPGPLEIGLSVVKASVIAGEPVVIQVTLRSSVAVEGFGDLTWGEAPFQILLDRGQGFVPYREHEFSSPGPRSGVGIPEGGEVSTEYVLSTDANIDDFMFPRPGSYRLVAAYKHPDLGTIRSNEVTVTVEPPPEAERPVYERLRSLGPVTIGRHGPGVPRSLKPVLEQYPSSVYLQEARVNDLRGKMGYIGNCYDPDFVLVQGVTPDCRADVRRQRYQSILALARNASAVEGPFRPAALLELASIYGGVVGDTAAEQATLREIIETYPNRVRAVALAKEGLDDAQPPAVVPPHDEGKK